QQLPIDLLKGMEANKPGSSPQHEPANPGESDVAHEDEQEDGRPAPVVEDPVSARDDGKLNDKRQQDKMPGIPRDLRRELHIVESLEMLRRQSVMMVPAL